MKDKYLIIDGYNMIDSHQNSVKLQKIMQEAREQLLDAIANYNVVVMKLYVCLMHMNNQV